MAEPDFDARLTPARPEVAAASLRGRIQAARFAEGEASEIAVPLAPLCGAPSAEAPRLTQALRGERVTIYDRPGDGWAWGQLDRDGYVGWVPEAALRAVAGEVTHRVITPSTLGFPAPSIKTPPRATLTLGATLRIVREEASFAVTDDGLFVPLTHIGPIASRETDFVAVAERFLRTPYLWGGKSVLGIDCSGLVQVALHACGIECPRDSDMQLASLGRDIELSELPLLQRGDLLFWKGHVAIARGSATLVHANAHHMMTAIENTRDAVERIEAAGLPLLAIKRLPATTPVHAD
jgi:hypothetical protein